MLCQQWKSGEAVMKRLLAIAAALALAACAGAPSAPPRQLVDQWYSAEGVGAVASLNLHETTAGWEGRIWIESGRGWPVRNVAQSGDTLSFLVPGLLASFSGTKNEQGWSGEWTTSAAKTPLTFKQGDIPAAAAGHFITLQGGRQIYMDCQGTGLPAVIFDSGAGGGYQSWKGVQEEIAKTNMACTYDRASFGASDPGPLPRDAAAVANDIDALLTAAKIPAPYILVAHSLGSYNVRQYANTRLNKVGGIVLVDPSGDNQRALFSAAIPKSATIPAMNFNEEVWRSCVAKLRGALVSRTDPSIKDCQGNDSEIVDGSFSAIHAMEYTSLQQLTASRRSYGDLPLIVLSRGDYEKGMPPEFDAADREAMKKVWTGLHRDMAALSTKGQFREVPGATHYIQTDAPAAVIAAIHEVIAARTR
jgi:pimeloyl-ACP methyl ester carboxylesterase